MTAADIDIVRRAAEARTACAALASMPASAPSALAALALVLDDIEAGQHPAARYDDWQNWQRSILDSIHSLAARHGLQAVCSEKYEYVRVEIHGSGLAYGPLSELAVLIELVTDRELLELQRP